MRNSGKRFVMEISGEILEINCCLQEEEEEEKPKPKKGGRGGKSDSGVRPKRATASRVWTNGWKILESFKNSAKFLNIFQIMAAAKKKKKSKKLSHVSVARSEGTILTVGPM